MNLKTKVLSVLEVHEQSNLVHDLMYTDSRIQLDRDTLSRILREEGGFWDLEEAERFCWGGDEGADEQLEARHAKLHAYLLTFF